MKRRYQSLLAVGLIVPASVFAVAAGGRPKGSADPAAGRRPEAPARSVRVQEIRGDGAVSESSYTGVVRARYESDLAFRVGGKVVSRHVELGERVRAGQPLRLNIRVPWGSNLGTLGDDPILLLNDFRDRAAVPAGPAPRTREGTPDLTGIWINVYNPDTPAPPLQPWAAELLRQRMANNSKDYPGG